MVLCGGAHAIRWLNALISGSDAAPQGRGTQDADVVILWSQYISTIQLVR
jgi:hypothetical protein